MIRNIRRLLYEQGFTIGGARQQLAGDGPKHHDDGDRVELIKGLRRDLEEVLEILRG
jgi:hypothetical protein